MPHSPFLMRTANKSNMNRVTLQVANQKLVYHKIARQLPFTQMPLKSTVLQWLWKLKWIFTGGYTCKEDNWVFLNRHLAELGISVFHSMVLQELDIQEHL